MNKKGNRKNTVLFLGILLIYDKMCDIQPRIKTDATGELKHFSSSLS